MPWRWHMGLPCRGGFADPLEARQASAVLARATLARLWKGTSVPWATWCGAYLRLGLAPPYPLMTPARRRSAARFQSRLRARIDFEALSVAWA